MAAGDLIDEDPALALRHAQAAKRRGARLPLVREAVAETAYAAEDFAVALTEYRALRRLTGDSAYLPVMADCERALGRPEEALRLVREAKLVEMTQRSRVELVIIEAGAREDLGQVKEGLRVLKAFLSHVSKDIPHEAHARLAYAYAAMLLRHDLPEEAREWFVTADELDTARELDAADQVELLDGVDLEFDFEDEEEEGEESEDTDEETDSGVEDLPESEELPESGVEDEDVPGPEDLTDADDEAEAAEPILDEDESTDESDSAVAEKDATEDDDATDE